MLNVSASKLLRMCKKIFENLIIDRAFSILTRRLKTGTISCSSPELVEEYLLHKLIAEGRETFGALWLDVKNRLICVEDIDWGTINTVCVHPREVLKSAVINNASNVIFYHNHPTGEPVPSHADKVMTADMKKLLRQIDVTLLDHIIVSGTKTHSFAKNGDL